MPYLPIAESGSQQEFIDGPPDMVKKNTSLPPLLASGQRLQEVRQILEEHPEIHAELERMAIHYASSPGYSVTDKKQIVPGGTRNDYVSLSKYYWPDPAKPDGLPWIVRDGIRNPVADEYDFPRFLEFCLAVTTLTGAAELLDAPQYRRIAGRFLRRWFLDPATRMNPNLDHAQFSPGNFPASPSGVIDFHFFCEVLEAVRHLNYNEEWTPGDLEALQEWFREFLGYLSTSPLARQEEAAHNNHGTWYDALHVSIALFIGDRTSAQRQLERHTFSRLDSQIASDATMPYELERTLSLTYCYFNLLGWTTLAVLAQEFQIDLWNKRNYHGVTLRHVFRQLLPTFLGETAWPYRQIAPAPRAIEYCRLFSLATRLEDLPELHHYMDTVDVNPIWRIAYFMTDDNWQQPPRNSEQERIFFSSQ